MSKPDDGRATLIQPSTIRFERLLPGPIERVWEYLTVSEKRAAWLAAGEFDLRVGGRIELIVNN
ncbi:MAG TPA: SRPBCC domain-containing protein, partial [Burkholderiales bacterium]|nr:SRPBCC domain-containing protein [Burkholderiales bacterium]